jgi:hypothetical protein
MACSLLAVYLLGGKVAAQQVGAGSALTSNANPGAENVRANEVKPAALGTVSLQSLVAEALEQNPEIRAMGRVVELRAGSAERRRRGQGRLLRPLLSLQGYRDGREEQGTG